MANEKIVNRENLKAFRQELDNRYAKPNGNYPTMTVGVADQLSPYDDQSGDYQDEPFSFQATGTGNGTQPDFATGAIALMKEKQGHTICVNQLVDNYNFESSTGWSTGDYSTISVANNTLTATIVQLGTAYYGARAQHSVQTLTIGHKYLISCYLKPSKTNDMFLCFREGNSYRQVGSAKSITANVWNDFTKIVEMEYACNYVVVCFNATNNANLVVNDTIQVKDFICIDLTQWFNGDIPQDLLDNPSNFFRYYNGSLDYNTGTLVNADGRYIKCIGMNQWDEEWEQGVYNETTGLPNNASRLRCKNPIKVIPNITYYIYSGTNSGLFLYFYDKNDNFLFRQGSGRNTTFTIPSNACYLRFNMYSEYGDGTTYNNDISINLYYEDEARCLTYEPYEVLTNNDTGTEVLRSAGNVKDYKEPNGTIHRLVGVVDLSTLTFTLNQNNGLYESEDLVSLIKIPTSGSVKANISCNKYIAVKRDDATSTSESISISSSGKVCINSSSATITGTLYYALKTPTTEQGTSYSENLVIDDFGSMDFQGTNGVPQGNLIFYPVDYKAFADTLYKYTEGTPSELALKSDVKDIYQHTINMYNTSNGVISFSIFNNDSTTYTNASKVKEIISSIQRLGNISGTYKVTIGGGTKSLIMSYAYQPSGQTYHYCMGTCTDGTIETGASSIKLEDIIDGVQSITDSAMKIN